MIDHFCLATLGRKVPLLSPARARSPFRDRRGSRNSGTMNPNSKDLDASFSASLPPPPPIFATTENLSATSSNSAIATATVRPFFSFLRGFFFLNSSFCCGEMDITEVTIVHHIAIVLLVLWILVLSGGLILCFTLGLWSTYLLVCSINISDLRGGQRHDKWLNLRNIKMGKLHLAIVVYEDEAELSTLSKAATPKPNSSKLLILYSIYYCIQSASINDVYSWVLAQSWLLIYLLKAYLIHGVYQKYLYMALLELMEDQYGLRGLAVSPWTRRLQI